MKRRQFITLLGGAAAWPLAAEAQAVARPARIGLVPIGSPFNPSDQALVNAFRQGLRELGLVENQDVTIDIVWVRNESEFPQVIKELVERGAKILIPAGTSAAVGGKARNVKHSDCVHHGRGPHRHWHCREPRASRRQRDRL